MKCLSRTEIQEYLDGETDLSLMTEISGHLKICDNCSTLYRQIADDKKMIIEFLDQAGKYYESDSIPEFVLPDLKQKKSIFKRSLPILAAALITGFIFLFRFDREQVTENIPEAEILLYEYYDGKDLNKMWHEKSQIIILQDEKGNIIQPILTY